MAPDFFKLEIVISSMVGLLGLFIALWIVNRERNKKITENHFYKVQILWHIWKMLSDIEIYYLQFKVNDHEERSGNLDKPKEEANKDMKKVSISVYDLHERQIETLNVNTYVPADVRHNVLRLLRDGIGSILHYDPRFRHDLNVCTVEERLLNPLDVLIDLEYFTGDRSSDVRRWLGDVKSMRRAIKDIVDEPEKYPK